MFNLVSLLVAAALVSVQCGLEANAQIDNTILDNNLQPNVITPVKRLLKQYVRFALAPPETIHHVGGQPLVLECQVYGSPCPSVAWLRNGEPVSDLEEDSNEIMAPHPESIARLTSKLVVTSPANGDIYTCVATAGLKQKTSSTTMFTEQDSDLLTLQQLLRLPTPPVITAFYDDVLQEMGTNLLLPCRATSGDIEWRDSNNQQIDNSRMRVLPSGDLLIMGLRWADMGTYTCTATNAIGKDTVHPFVYPVKP